MKKIKEAKSIIIYNRKWKVHPKHPDYAFAENGDVCDMVPAPPKILKRQEGIEVKTNRPFIRVKIRNKKGTKTYINVAAQLVYLYDMKPWGYSQEYGYRYKDGDFRNIDISNLEVYKRNEHLNLLSEDDIEEIVALLRSKELSMGEIAEKFNVSKSMIFRISKKHMKRKSRRRAKGFDVKDVIESGDSKVVELLKRYTIREGSRKYQRNRRFQYRCVNPRLSNYRIWGMINYKRIFIIKPGIKKNIEAEVELLNNHFFG